MSEVEQHADAPAGSKKVIKWTVGVLLVLLLAAIVVMNLPRGFSDDLSRIGKGKPAVVLVRDKESVESFNLMTALNNVRGKYDGRVEFLLVDFDTPEGRAFITSNNAARVTLVLFDAGGKLVKILYPPQTADSVRQEIDAISGEGL